MKLLKLKKGENVVRLLPPKGYKWDYPHFNLVPIKEKKR